MKTNLLILIALMLGLSGCEDLFSPMDENNQELKDIYNDAAFAEGLLMNGYVYLPSSSYSFNDVATDDAVSNDPDNDYLSVATGGWSAINNPTSRWDNAYSAIQYLNVFLSEVDSVNWAVTGDYVKAMFRDRLKGEAYGLRALYLYYLLEAHAGKDATGKLLGVPILTAPLNGESSFDMPRNTFEECIDQINIDIAEAENYLPLDYEDLNDGDDVPAKYTGKTTVPDYNRVFGAFNKQRLSKRILLAIKAKVALLAASPAFDETISWEDAAKSAGVVLDMIGGVSGLDPNGGTWYSRDNKDITNGLAAGSNPPEILWRTNISEETDLEEDNYCPSLYGHGRVNPTQNLVDAFPMVDGYPISESDSYDPNNPYAERDPRLGRYIVYDGSKFGPSSSVIRTYVADDEDGIGVLATSTRTGYYMRKLLREDVNLNPANVINQKHYVTRIRYTELFLAYAEAANEAWGPTGTGSHGYSAKDVIAAIRQRAGIEEPDSYLSSISTKEEMRTLIRNERRLELCFEGFRFWDLRRWNSNLNETAKGMRITENGEFKVINVENRTYRLGMNYGPLPYQEVIKWGLTQNAGW
nr:RagB/SusD family nutrient uptake outer membrane protein [uncultured Draconibacterium sp.]